MPIKKKPDYDDWFDKYKPIKNHIDDNASYDGCFFETFGEEEKYVKEFAQKHPERVWTVLTGIAENDYVVAGWHYVNRFGYFITKLPAENPDLDFEIL